MDDLDPIKQLQSLLDDRGKVLEKISGIHSALNSLKSPTPGMPAAFAPLADPNPNLAGEGPLYDRLLQALHDMQAQIEERVRAALSRRRPKERLFCSPRSRRSQYTTTCTMISATTS